MATAMRDEIEVGGMAIRFLVEGEESGGSVAVFEFDVPTGTKVAAAHSHDGYEETIYGLEGVLTWTIEGAQIDVGPGQALLIPRGAVHRFDNAGDVDGLTDTVVGRPCARVLVDLVVAERLASRNVLAANSMVHIGLDATGGDTVDGNLLLSSVCDLSETCL